MTPELRKMIIIGLRVYCDSSL